MIELVLFGTFLVCLFIGVPVAMSMGLSAFATIMFTGGMKALAPASSILYAGLSSETLLAIPFFILAGVIMELTGISRRLVEFADACFGHMKNGIALTAILTALLFSSISGSGPATVAAIGGILIPALAKHGYSKRHAASLVATSGELGIILPPSIAYIVFAVVAADYAGPGVDRVTIGRLFMAGVVPGLILVVVLYFIARFLPRDMEIAKANAATHLSEAMGKNPRSRTATVTATGAVASTADNTGLLTIDDVTPANASSGGGIGMRAERAPAGVVFKAFMRAVPGLLVPVIILGGIYGGIFTPTESAAVASVYALVVGLFVTRELKLPEVFKIFTSAGIMSGRIMLIIASATLFAYVITRNQIARHVADWMLSITDSMVLLVLIINLALLIAGMFLDAISAFYLFIPLFVPVLLELGMNLTTIGVMMTMNLAIGLITPPVGIDLFVAASIAKIPFGEAVKGVVPFVVSGIAVLMLVTFIPALSNWLPDLLGL
ncbi:TRAP transporter large permease [Leucobacter komagatae]|uniref:C4-dicarboxylate ABC transporter permease n=1 Tax=Leucobacter komagatae TaxID=55969 RepID=A0A0D0IQU9_9MICO|nr:TRAP transporter large permease [Leucobacter komagatae]KIP53397.1 C4-dicarboxylate ABC transporter permease [Leucobacter komagatae]